MAKFSCMECGTHYTKWSGRCYTCGSWNSISEEGSDKIPRGITKASTVSKITKDLPPFHKITDATEDNTVNPTPISELNRVLGGGIVEGSIVLFGGEPGIGKSTIMLQVSSGVADYSRVIYISGEESMKQIQLRAKRLDLQKSKLLFACTSSLEKILSTIDSLSNRDLVVIDSIQTVYSDDAVSIPGSISQVKYCANEITTFAKDKGVTVFMVGHITKDGQIAGPKVLEHMVDTVIFFETDETKQYRMLRAIKNRFGPVNEIGIFEMTASGLKEVTNPSEIFLNLKKNDMIGSIALVTTEGTRTIIADVECLITDSYAPAARRWSVGIDRDRLSLIVAVLASKLKMKLYDKDIYINVSGGLKINETASDVAVAMVIISTMISKPIPRSAACFGEITLSGDIRPVTSNSDRIKEATKLGFKAMVCPKLKSNTKTGKSEIVEVKNVYDLLSYLQNF